MWTKIGLAGLGLIILIVLLAGYQGRQDQAHLEEYQAIMQDISDGKTIAGTLTATMHLVCMTPGDAYNSVYGADNSQASDAQSQLTVKLVVDQRCAFAANSDHFDITTDGKERFTTPHGVLELWPAPHH